jgi:hypothetical protein
MFKCGEKKQCQYYGFRETMTMCHERGEECAWPWLDEYSDDDDENEHEHPHDEKPEYPHGGKPEQSHGGKPEQPYSGEPKTPYGKPPAYHKYLPLPSILTVPGEENTVQLTIAPNILQTPTVRARRPRFNASVVIERLSS